MNAAAGPFAGMDRKEARRAVKKALAEKGLARGTKPHVLTLPRCQRSGGVVEPMISTQWFLRMKAMAENALEAVRSGKTVIIPAEWEKTYDHFLENIQDWCVSRQLWWGHPIPAWHGPGGEIKVARARPPETFPEVGSKEPPAWTPDPDVLDTWSSSALWPMSTVGWPEVTDAFKKFYPASDLETGYDILFFWVARMMMFGLHFTGQAPFRRVLLHGLVVDETGEKMSKVKGNVIDPLALVSGSTFAGMLEQSMPGVPEAEALAKFKKAYPSAASMGNGFPAFGADAVRFTLATYSPSNKRIALAPRRIEGNRHFLNKIWNASRLALDLLGSDFSWRDDAPGPAGFYNRWIRIALRRGVRRRARGAGHLPHRRGGSRRLPLLLGRPLRLVPGAGQARPAQVAGGCVPAPGDRARDARDARVRARGQPAPLAPPDAVHHRGALAARTSAGLPQGEPRVRAFPDEGRRARVARPGDRRVDGAPAAGRLGGPHHPERARARPRPRCRSRCARPTPRSSRSFADTPRRFARSCAPGASRVFEAPGGPRAPGTTVSMVASAQGPIEVLVPSRVW